MRWQGTAFLLALDCGCFLRAECDGQIPSEEQPQVAEALRQLLDRGWVAHDRRWTFSLVVQDHGHTRKAPEAGEPLHSIAETLRWAEARVRDDGWDTVLADRLAAALRQLADKG